jgi:hypothetical protein
MTLRNIRSMQTANDGTRSLDESILIPEVEAALKAWKTSGGGHPILIGGLAYSFYAKPRFTQDVDFLFLSPSDVPEIVNGFKRNRTHSFEHIKTGVEIEVLDPAHLGIPHSLVMKVQRHAVDHGWYRLPSLQGLIALKIMRLSLQDKADIAELLKLGLFNEDDWPEIPFAKRTAFTTFRKTESI